MHDQVVGAAFKTLGAPTFTESEPRRSGEVSFMDLADLGRTLRRRWYLTLLVIALAIAVAMLGWGKAKPTYTAAGTILLMPPASVVDAKPTDGAAYSAQNPLLYLGGLTEARDAVVSAFSTETTRADLADNYQATVEITSKDGSTAPIIVFSVEATDAAQAEAGLKHLVSQASPRLVQLQDGLKVAAKDRVTFQTLSADDKATASHKKQLELAVVGFAGTLGLGLLLIALIDGRRQARRIARETSSGVPPKVSPRRTRSEPGGRGLRRGSKTPAADRSVGEPTVDDAVPSDDLVSTDGVSR